MDKHAWWKWLLLVAMLGLSLSRVMPFEEKVRFGLDLKGGISFVVNVDEAKIEKDIREDAKPGDNIEALLADALKDSLERSIEVLRNRLDRIGIEEPSIVKKADRIEIQLPGIGEDKREEAEAMILSVGFLEFRMVHERSRDLAADLLAEGKAPRGYDIVTVEGQPYYIPNDEVPDAERGEAFLAERGKFEIPSPSYEFLLEAVEIQKQVVYRPHFVNTHPVLRSRDLKNSKLQQGNLGQNAVGLEFTVKGAKRFADVTEKYCIGGTLNPDGERSLAIVIDGTLYSAPRINEPIFGGNAQITGSFDIAEATRLVNVLRSGALPTRVKIVEKRYVAPSLGKDSIDSGLKSIFIGGICVVVFMAGYYLLCGIVADVALVLNMLLLPLGMIIAAGFLSMGKGVGGGAIALPVLTLPGVAGILLTIGMAVDANVLIFERIREERGTGKKLWTAIQAGYDRAFVTIMDANVTTLMVGIILFIFGSGPIRGFAVTLCGGIIISMFTALVITKLIFSLIATRTPLKSLKMLSIVKKTSVNFVGMRRFASMVSIAVIAVSCGLLVVRTIQTPGQVFGVDFTGGASTTFSFNAQENGVPVPMEQLRAALADAGVLKPTIQYQKELDSAVETSLQVKTGTDLIGEEKQADVVERTLVATFPDVGFDVVQEDEVGSQIGDELKKSAVWAIVWALVGIIIYISWRFEFGFALGAIVALVHDVLVTVGIFSATGHQISLPIIAALLTIVGYSVNDTIVVFDRIREDLRLLRKPSFKEICNLSINQTLSRTLLTSFTTLITVVMLLVFGGGAIFDFALALCIGVLVGTYSSIFVATPVVLLWYRDKKPDFAVNSAQV
ncbi:MAG: protein translocase subunit SecD [Verrucomicrobia bacterium]|jgi:SecD/SecF fusion protein|nr:protein translocase subunit SecD [Verrucomicrobiota bacterium]